MTLVRPAVQCKPSGGDVPFSSLPVELGWTFPDSSELSFLFLFFASGVGESFSWWSENALAVSSARRIRSSFNNSSFDFCSSSPLCTENPASIAPVIDSQSLQRMFALNPNQPYDIGDVWPAGGCTCLVQGATDTWWSVVAFASFGMDAQKGEFCLLTSWLFLQATSSTWPLKFTLALAGVAGRPASGCRVLTIVGARSCSILIFCGFVSHSLETAWSWQYFCLSSERKRFCQNYLAHWQL